MGGIVAIVGRPNVGKSTFFNRLIKKREAIVDAVSGVTRDRHYGQSDWNGIEFSLIDTGGYIEGSDDVFQKEIDKQVNLAIEEADAILFMVDVADGLTGMDETIAQLLRRSQKPVFLTANKADNSKVIENMNEFLKKDDKLMRNDLTAYDYKSGKLYGTNGAEINNDSINARKKARRRQRPRDFGFQHIEPLPQFEDKDVAAEMLNAVANNPGVLKVMEKHKWKVPILKELYPDGKVGETDECVMGLNKNNGEEILLRIRTDDLKGFRKMESVLNVLYHVSVLTLICKTSISSKSKFLTYDVFLFYV